jgi:hypothetical protein
VVQNITWQSRSEYHFVTLDAKHERYVMECQGPLNIARYEKSHFFSIFESCGFEVERFDHGTELDRQSGIYLRPVPGSPSSRRS